MSTARRGFTLLEVLIALAVFAGAVVVLGASYINVLNAYARVGEAAQEDQDLRFARQSILVEPELEEVEKGGDFETTDGRRVTWQATIEPTEVADLFTVIFTCEVGGAPDREPRVVEQRFRLLRPSWSKPEERAKLRAEAAERIARLQEGRW